MRITNGYHVDNIKPVTLKHCMGNDDLVVDAARVSFSKQANMYSVKQNQKLIQYLAKHEHWTPFAHPQLCFHFAAPIAIARQLDKHQIGFVKNEVSRRYVSDEPMIFVPETFRQRPENMKQGSVTEGEVPVQGDVLEDVKADAKEAIANYNALLNRGVCPEQARFYLPQNMITEWYWTGSLYGWLRMVKQREDSHAQAECYPYAAAVKAAIKERFPLVYGAFYDYD